ncbi:MULTISPECIES: hypothetical protein [unclassified Pseudoxanthomonas]|uniref:hypothetical protein n=1 Tax=unclassified Pseudoxanthomonas TaxID=2645906 RepID=UPI003076BCB4
MLDHFTLHRRAVKVLPPAIRTSGVVADDDPYALSKLLFPLRRKSSGALVYRLTEEAAVAMADDPLAYLKDAVQAREGLGRRRAPFAYRAWRKAMLPAGWSSVWLPKAAEPTPDVTEAYFTAKNDGKALLVVIPSQRLAFYLWCD